MKYEGFKNFISFHLVVRSRVGHPTEMISKLVVSRANGEGMLMGFGVMEML